MSFYIQNRRISQARYQRKQEATRNVCLVSFILRSEGEGDTFLRNVVHFQRTTRHYIPADRTLHNDCVENLISHIHVYVFIKVLFTLHYNTIEV
jgi:hypothetical protein